MNEFVDMHVHSKFSIDGMSTMEDYCLIAGKTGTRVICFTEHVDFNSAEKNLSIVKDNRKQNFVVDDYFREINRLRKKYGSLTLLSGIEFSEPSLFPEEFALYSSYPFDCITAGIHHCYNSVFPGAGNLSVSKAIYEYYQIMQKTVELGGFQVLAHLDFPKLFFDKWVIDDDVLDMILSTMIDKNILLEVNTSCLYDRFLCRSLSLRSRLRQIRPHHVRRFCQPVVLRGLLFHQAEPRHRGDRRTAAAGFYVHRLNGNRWLVGDMGIHDVRIDRAGLAVCQRNRRI